jgi:cell division septum initiation protein DivIVA
MEKWIAGGLTGLEVLGVLVLAAVAFILLRSKVLQQTASGWKELAEQREQENLDLEKRLNAFKAETDTKFAGQQAAIEAQKTATDGILAENKTLKDLNIELQRQARDMTESNRCLTDEISKLRGENLELHKELVRVTLQMKSFELQVAELTRRLHTLGESTREPR